MPYLFVYLIACVFGLLCSVLFASYVFYLTIFINCTTILMVNKNVYIGVNLLSYCMMAVHFQKIIHRDIKPSNLLLADNDHIKVTFKIIYKMLFICFVLFARCV